MGAADKSGNCDDDTALHLNQAARGQAKSLAWIVDRFSPYLLAQAAYRIEASLRRHFEPEDLVQDVWAAVLPKLSTIEGVDAGGGRLFMKYLSTTLVRRLRDLMEKHILGKPTPIAAGSSIDPLAELPADVSGVVTRATRDELRHEVGARIEALDARDREVVILRGIEQLPVQDIALILDEKPNTISVTYRRALTKLRDQLPLEALRVFADP